MGKVDTRASTTQRCVLKGELLWRPGGDGMTAACLPAGQAACLLVAACVCLSERLPSLALAAAIFLGRPLDFASAVSLSTATPPAHPLALRAR